MQPDELRFGSEFDVHGDGVEDERGDGNAVEQRRGADGAGFGGGRRREYDGDVCGHGGNDHN